MAIIIPSKSIYEKKNDKVIDNVIEKAIVPLQTFTKKIGNVLKKEYSYEFFYTKKDDDGNIEKEDEQTVKIYKDFDLPTENSPTKYTASDGTTFSIIYQSKTNILGITQFRYVARARLVLDVSDMVVIPDYKNQSIWYQNKNIFYNADNPYKDIEGYLPKSSALDEGKAWVGYDVVEWDDEKRTITVDIGFPISQYGADQGLTNTFTLELRRVYWEADNNNQYHQSTEEKSTEENTWVSQTNNLMQKDFGISSLVLSEYKNGKETATITCSISDFYDESGNLVISKSKEDLPMTFKVGDQVIPMYYSSDGTDKPFSLYEDGSPKAFRVVKTKVYYDGAVWQQLYLQEV